MTCRKKAATYEDLLRVPDLYIAEIVDGELFATRRPPLRGVIAFSAIAALVINHAEGSDGDWWILNRIEVHLGSDVLVPDVAGWRKSRMPILYDIPFVEIVPDWICEVLSAHTQELDRVHKMPAYMRHGVPHMWVIDPDLRMMEVWSNGELIQRASGNEIVRAEPFESLEIELYDLWPFPPTPQPPQS